MDFQTSSFGAKIEESELNLSDNTTADVSTSAHGFCPKAPNDTSKVLVGDGTWATNAVIDWDFVDSFAYSTLLSTVWSTGGNPGTLDTTASVYALNTTASAGTQSTINTSNKFQLGGDADADPYTSLTYETEIKINPTSAAITFSSGVRSNTSSAVAEIYHTTSTTSEKAVLRTHDGTTEQLSSEFAFSTATWHKVRITYDGTDVKCYVDGTLVATNSTNVPPTTDDLYLWHNIQNEAVAAVQTTLINYTKFKAPRT